MTEPVSIHISDIRAFRSCRRRWNWSSALGRNLEPAVPYIPFFTGRAIHHATEMYYGPDRVALDKALDVYLEEEMKIIERNNPMWPEEKAALALEVDLMRGLLAHYKMWVDSDTKMYSDKNLEFISLEQEFDVPLPTASGKPSKTMRLGGRFDGIVRHKITGEYWIWESKTTRSIKELTRSLANDEQSTAYIYAASQMFDYPVVGVLYNMMRKKEPTRPRVLQSGAFSLASNIDTTAFFFLQCIHEEYPDWSVETIDQFYGQFLEGLKTKEFDFFLRFPIYRTKYEVDLLMKNIFYTAQEMINPRLRIYPAPGWLSCNMCHFRSPCLAMNSGGDHEVLLREEYQLRVSATSMRGEEASADEH